MSKPDILFSKVGQWNLLVFPNKTMAGTDTYQWAYCHTTVDTLIKKFVCWNNSVDPTQKNLLAISPAKGSKSITMAIGAAKDYADFIDNSEYVIPGGWNIVIYSDAGTTGNICGGAVLYKGGIAIDEMGES